MPTGTTADMKPQASVTAKAARRFLLRRTGLGRLAGEGRAWAGPQGTAAAVRALEYVQVDPMQVLACNHDLVLGARVARYRPGLLDDALYRDRTLVEVVARNRCIVPASDYWIFRLRFAEIEHANRPQLAALEPVMEQVLRRIEAEGGLSSLDFEDDTRTSGWWEPDGQARTRAVRQALEWLWHFGRVAISSRTGQRRHFDLPERLFGPAAAAPPYDPAAPALRTQDADRLRDALLRKYCRAMGLVDTRDWSFGWTRYTAPERKALAARSVREGWLVPVRIEGVKNTYYVAADEVDSLLRAGHLEFEADVRFLPPLDNLIWLRGRLGELFGVDYTWEAYTPQSKRKYGPYTCLILRGDLLVGRIDAHLDRGRSTLIIDRVWWEPDARPVSAGEMGTALEEWAQANGAAAAGDPSAALLRAARATL